MLARGVKVVFVADSSADRADLRIAAGVVLHTAGGLEELPTLVTRHILVEARALARTARLAAEATACFWAAVPGKLTDYSSEADIAPLSCAKQNFWVPQQHPVTNFIFDRMYQVDGGLAHHVSPVYAFPMLIKCGHGKVL